MHRLRTLLPLWLALDICPPVHEKYEAEFHPLHMKWVLVDDTKGNPRPQMRWVVDR